MSVASLVNPRQVGTLYRDSYAPAIAERVLDEVLHFSSLDLQRERGGFLIGNVVPGQPPIVLVRHFLPASETRESPTSLTFTHETWSAARIEIESRFPGEAIVGWQHTHPGMGIFLSHHDRFIQKHFFPQPWQIALVVDPKQQEFGFFHWRSGQVQDVGFLCVGG